MEIQIKIDQKMKALGVVVLLIFIFGFLSGCDNPVQTKTTNIVPPTLISPPDGAISVELDPTFVWSGNCNKLEIDYTPSFSPPIFTKTVSGTQYKIPPDILAYNTVYYWRAGIQSGTAVVWSTRVFGFRTGQKP